MTIKRELVFAENLRLETERLILRPVTLEDAEDMFAYASDDETTKYVFETHTSVENTKESIAVYFMSQPLGKYGIELKETGKLIGTINLRVTETNNKGDVGYTLHKDYWGKGITTEAAKKLVVLGFEELGLHRIEAFHDVKNPNSGRVMEKIGMQKEGVMRNNRLFKGEYATDALYGITLEDYNESQEK